MKSRLMFASLFTLGVLLGMVATVMLLVLYYVGSLNAVSLIALTIFFNALSWLLAPWIQDLLIRWIYKGRHIPWDEFSGTYPDLAASIEKTCAKRKISIPRMLMIDDGNPTAYCFGSGSWNSRVVATAGLFHYLDDDEVKAVYSHELGHISNGDFALMTFAATLLMVLYEVYVIISKGKGKDRDNRLAWIGYVSYIFWVIGTYLVLYLSRTREYLADRFAAEETRNPNALATALVKIAYGIAAAPDTASSKRLLVSTRAMGIYDYRAADAAGSAYARFARSSDAEGGVAVAPPLTEGGAATARAPERVERVFLFDLHNPWAKIGEYNSTHPLTGKRIRKLMEYCQEFSIAPTFDFSLADYEGQFLDKKRLYKNFGLEVLIYFAPAIGFVLGILAALVSAPGPAIFAPILGLGLGWSLRGLYCFPAGTPERTTVFELMCDPYASPVRGRLVYLEGTMIGRAEAGSPVGEDFMVQDSTGLIMVNYESWLPFFGNLWFGWRKVKNMMGDYCSATGWFRRYTSSYVDLNQMKTNASTVESYTRFWGIYKGPAVILLALLMMAAAR